MNDVRVGQTRMCRINRRPYVIVDVDSAGQFGIDFRQSGRPGTVRFSAAELQDDEIVGAPEEEENVTQVIEPEVGQTRHSRDELRSYEILHVGNHMVFIRYVGATTECLRHLSMVIDDTLISPLPLPEGWMQEDATGFTCTDADGEKLFVDRPDITMARRPAVRVETEGIVDVNITDLRLILDRIEKDLTNEEA